MRCRPITRAMISLAVLTIGAAWPAGAGQLIPPRDLSKMSIEDLMRVEVVSTASKFPQTTTEAPASITIITADAIRRFGYRSLSDALRSVRGFYTTYDRNYAYVGVRGFARPGDYSTRVLLLVDGHRLNDSIYDQAPMGTDFPVDVALIERIEVIRGPGSSLYGTNALLAVINVVTNTGGGRKGTRIGASGGTLETAALSGSFGRVFANGREALISATGYRSAGQQRLYFAEFQDAVNEGVVTDADRDSASSLFGSLSVGRFSIRGAAVHREKRVPTASFGTVFGDGRERTIDARAFVSGVYDGPIGRGWMGTARAGYDYYRYHGDYPFDYGSDGIAVYDDHAVTHAVSGELTARRRLGQRHQVTAGLEVRRNLRTHQFSRSIFGEDVNVNAPSANLGIYAQDEIRPAKWLIVNGGIRFDRLSVFGTRVTPRAAIVVLPSPRTAVKLLHGRAFRAPNAYERFYYSVNRRLGDILQPEQIVTTELVWEQILSKAWRVAASAFSYDIDRIIEQRSAAGTDDLVALYFANVGRSSGRGIEAEIEFRLESGIVARASHAFTNVTPEHEQTRVSNSPGQLSTVAVQLPVSELTIGVDGRFVGERLALDGSAVPGFFVPNVTVSSPAGGRLAFSLSVYNVFNRRHADPGAEEHTQSAIQQDGRTVLARFTFGF